MPFAELGYTAVAKRVIAAFALEPAARVPEAAADFHRMRIAIKKVKYALELFLGALGKPARRAHKPISELQELMGEVHDCDVLLGAIEAATGDAISKTAARRAAKSVAADRERLYSETLTLLDQMREDKLRDNLLDALD